MTYAILESRTVLAVSGADRENFLQGVITGNAARLPVGGAGYSALLSPQGKFLHDFFLYKTPDAILIDCHQNSVEDLRKRLSFYKLRADVKIDCLEGQSVIACWGEAPAQSMPADPRLAALGHRTVGNAHALRMPIQANEADYHRMRVMLGVPDGALDMNERSFIMEWGFEQLHGIDFAKGCYIGQEVTARMKYRTDLKKCLHIVRADAALPASGTPILQGTEEAGVLASISGNQGIALLRFEVVEKGALTAGGMPLTISVPGWFKRACEPGQSQPA